jgi:hypothetical protein
MHFLPKKAVVQPSKTAPANTIGIRVALGFLFSTKKDQIGMHFLPKKAVVQPLKTTTANTIRMRVALGFLFRTKNYQIGMLFLPEKGSRAALGDHYCNCNRYAHCAWIFIQY